MRSQVMTLGSNVARSEPARGVSVRSTAWAVRVALHARAAITETRERISKRHPAETGCRFRYPSPRKWFASGDFRETGAVGCVDGLDQFVRKELVGCGAGV